ncbi:MAG: GNAT family N-acetyltransferase [Amphritea sp.]
MHVREAVLDDAGSINGISTGLGYTAVSVDIARNRLDLLLNSESDVVWVLEKQGQVVGWLHTVLSHRLASESFVEIAGMAVCSGFRRQGVGRNLIGHAQHWAHVKHLNLRVRCNSLREGSHNFYQAVGFVKLKSQDVFEGRS